MTAAKTLLALLAIATPALAQPRPSCEVRFVRAPDDVRHVIETWVAAEPRCASTIDLRVIRTDEGLYLIAQRPDGRIHERWVPDAQSAGVLVASWIADDWVVPDRDAVAPVAAPVVAPPLTQPVFATPSETPVMSGWSAPATRRDAGPRWLTVATTLSAMDSDDGGVRGELDLISRRNLTLGAALGWTETSMVARSGSGEGEVRSDDVAATIYGAYTLRHARWELRGAVGLGGVYTASHGAVVDESQRWRSFDGSGAGIIGTASALVTRRVGDRWGVQAGILGHIISERISEDGQMDILRNDAHVFLFMGIRRRI